MHNVRQASYLGQDLMPWILGELRVVHKFGASSAKTSIDAESETHC